MPTYGIITSFMFCVSSSRCSTFFSWKILISFLFLHKNLCCGYSLEAPCQWYFFFLVLHESTCCGYSLEVPQWGASKECPQHKLSWRNKKNITWLPPLNWGTIWYFEQFSNQQQPVYLKKEFQIFKSDS